MKIAIVGAGVAGSYLFNRLDGHEVECFEMRPQDKWYTVCAWGTSAPYISDMVKKAGFNFEDYILHRGIKMMVDYGTGTFDMQLKGLVTYDKHRLCEDMLKGHNVHWGTQVKQLDGRFDDFDIVVDATGMQRPLLPKIKNDILVPCVEYQVKSSKLPCDDFYIRPYRGLSGYFWYFPLGDGTGPHRSRASCTDAYKGEVEAFLKKYDCEVIRKIGRPVRVIPPAYCQPFSEGRWSGWGESIGTVYPAARRGDNPEHAVRRHLRRQPPRHGSILRGGPEALRHLCQGLQDRKGEARRKLQHDQAVPRALRDVPPHEVQREKVRSRDETRRHVQRDKGVTTWTARRSGRTPPYMC